MFDRVFAQGPFGKAQPRYYRDVRVGTLSLDARLDSGLVATNMDLRKHGQPPPPCVLSPTHLGGSERYFSLGFTSARGVRSTASSLTRRSDSTRSWSNGLASDHVAFAHNQINPP